MKPVSIRCFAFLLVVTSAIAFPAVSAATDVPAVAESAPAPVAAETWKTFETLFDTINQARNDLADLRTRLVDAPTEAERERIRNDIDVLQSNIDSLQLAWEMWATGGVDLQLFQPKKAEKFDWRQEIQSVFEPIVVELQRLTERPRKLERLRTEQAFYAQRFAASSAALINIDDYKSKSPPGSLQNAFNDLEANWRRRHEEIKSHLTLINLQLDELEASSGVADAEAGEAFKELLSGRFVNLLLAVLAAAVTFAVLLMVSRLYLRLVTHKGRRRPFVARAAHLAFMIFAVVLALLAAVAVLYMRGDRILLGLLLIALVGLALTLQRTLPAMIKEARVLLNVGPVREGERVIYNGLPWKVQSLNMFSTLVNPLLTGGMLRLPLNELTGLISRPPAETEPWFPCREQDFVLLSDGTYGRVLLQTPEQVQLRVLDSERTYPVAAFLDGQPQNLSREGFGVVVRFGVDYQYQPLIHDIRRILEEQILARCKQHPLGEHLKHCFVEFDEAAASSLNFLIYAAFAGTAADAYFRIRRLLQTFAVDISNGQGWIIPFNQMTVHLEQKNRREKRHQD